MDLDGESGGTERRNSRPSAGVPKGDQFYFINKTGKSTHLSQSSSTEQAAIQSHVQRGRRRSRRGKLVSFETYAHFKSNKEPENSSKPNSSNPGQQVNPFVKFGQEKHPQKPTHQGESEPLHDQHHPTKHTTPNPSNARILFVDSSPNISQRDRELEDARRKAHAAREAHRKRRAASDIPSPTSQTDLCKVDPFNTASVKFDNTVAGLLHYYVYFYHPTLWPNEMAVLRHGLYTFQGSLNRIVKTAIEDKLTMFCLLSAAASRLQFIDRLPCPQVTGKERYYLQNALQLLRSRIDTSVPPASEQLRQLLICIVFLTSAEAYRDEISAAKTHLRAAVGLLEQKGGLKYIQDENLRGQLAMGDLFLACVKLEPCLFNCDYDPGPATALSLQEGELSPLWNEVTVNYWLNRDLYILPLNLSVLIEQVLEAHSIKVRLQTSLMPASRVMEITHWISKRNMAIRHRLLALTTNDLTVHALRVSIIMWTLLTMNVTGRTKTVKVMAPTLRSILAGIPPSDWASNEDINLWILVVGFSCAVDGSEDSTWYVKQCCRFSSWQGSTDATQDWDEKSLAERLENFQRGFLFDAEIQRPRTKRLALQLLLQSAR
jgi:hypothetical protein